MTMETFFVRVSFVMLVAIALALALGGCGHPDEFAGPFTAIDGDTLAKGNERYRIEGIDAPELPGHCQAGRQCAPGNPYAAQAYLQALADQGIWCRGSGRDRHNRILVTCHTSLRSQDVGQLMVLGGYAQVSRRPYAARQ